MLKVENIWLRIYLCNLKIENEGSSYPILTIKFNWINDSQLFENTNLNI
jgi:hypothetical protein